MIDFNKFYLFITFWFFNHSSAYSQCDVKKTYPDSICVIYFMAEPFYKSDDSSDFVQVIFFNLNRYKDTISSNDSGKFYLFVTYAYTVGAPLFTPNQIQLIIGYDSLSFTAESKYNNTLNGFALDNESISTIECKFNIPIEFINQLLKEKAISKLIVYDYKIDKKIDVSNHYQKELYEMVNCILNFNEK